MAGRDLLEIRMTNEKCRKNKETPQMDTDPAAAGQILQKQTKQAERHEQGFTAETRRPQRKAEMAADECGLTLINSGAAFICT